MKLFYILFALIAGSALPVQIGVNTSLRNWLGNPILASFASFVVGSICLLIYVLVLRVPWPGIALLGRIPLWTWLGGALGAFYVAATVILAPRLGAATMVSLFVAGQLLTSLLLDHFGLIGYAQHSINLYRVFGALLLVAGALLILRF
jgi:bacterial/archaeal transporter family-2 protein